MTESLLDRGQRLHAEGKMAEAEACYRQVLQESAGDATASHYLAVVLSQVGRQAEARTILGKLLAGPTTHPDTPSLYALLCRDSGEYEEGIEACRRALLARPGDSLAQLLLGNLLMLVEDYPEAERHLRAATNRAPRLAEAWAYLGMALHRLGRWPEAIAAYRRSCDLQPGDHKIQFNIGLCADSSGDLEGACAALRHARRLAPHRADIVSRLAYIHAAMCDFENEAECIAALERILSDPESLEADDQVEPFLLAFLPLSRAADTTVLRRKAEQTDAEAAKLKRPETRVESGRDRPLRIGYLSADFGDHAVGSLISGLFGAHDRSVVSVHAYSLKRHQGLIAERLRRDADIFLDCDALSTVEVAAAIAADRIDVLVDLAGYTLGARPAILALRPAPVQLGYLGYLHSYAADWIDGIIVDETVCSAESDADYPEPLIRLPGTLFPGSPDLERGMPDRARFGLPEGVPLFASFNNSYKLDPELVDAWIQISRGVPDAHFLVYLPPAAVPRFRKFWSTHGGNTDRLRIAEKISAREHADRAVSCDLFLDAFRYQAGATAVAAAAAGLPLLTCQGDTLASRMGTSLNRFLGLSELVCHDTESYVQCAIAFGQDPSRLDSMKSQLRLAVQASGLLEPRRTAQVLESAIHAIWTRGSPR